MQDDIHDGALQLLLQSDALRAQECRGDLPADDGQSTCAHDRTKPPGVRGRHGGHLLGERPTRR